MSTPLDQKDKRVRTPLARQRNWNLVLIAIILSFPLFTIIKVWFDLENQNGFAMLLPRYTQIILNGSLINFSLASCIGLIPGIYLRAMKNYKLSTLFMLVIMIISFLIRHTHAAYEIFYSVV